VIPPFLAFRRWLMSTRWLQEVAYNTFPDQLEGDEFAEFMRFNALGLHTELSELMQEIPWKPWASVRGRPDEKHRRKAVVEAVDVLHFMANILTALRVSDEELTAAYRAKMIRNLERQREGYTGQDKCGECGRAPDEPPPTQIYDLPPGPEKYCPYCLAEDRPGIAPVSAFRALGQKNVITYECDRQHTWMVGY
jgi:hypothetical protein